jgi:hypothetical protein
MRGLVSVAFLALLPQPRVAQPPSFDEESRSLYGVVAPPADEKEVSAARAELDRLLPGKGPLAPRYAAFQKRFLVPKDRLEPALERAIGESRRRTLDHLKLPENERIRIEAVSGAPWPAFTRHLSGFESVIQVNHDFPLAVSNLLEIATHEAYPGHHTLNVLRGRGVSERAPREAILDESLAGYAVELAFPGDERLSFERDVLFPLVGLDPEGAEVHLRVEREIHRLAPLRVDAARAYLDRQRDRVQSVLFLENVALVPAPWAFLRFVDRYRTYVVAYTAGVDLVRRRIEGSTDRWHEYAAIIRKPDNES